MSKEELENDAYKLRIELAGADETILQLKQQLEEKEKEIERLQGYISCSGCVSVIAKANHEKISFAVEQLENARDAVKNVPIDDTCYDEYGFQEGTRDDCVEIIDNQIKQLKGNEGE